MKSASCLPRTWEFCTRWRRSSAVSSMARRRKGLLYQSLATQQRGAQRRCGGGGYGRDAAVKFPPAGQAATAASLRTDFTHTLRQSVRPSGSHARTHSPRQHLPLQLPSFTCTGAASLPLHVSRLTLHGGGGGDRGNYSIRPPRSLLPTCGSRYRARQPASQPASVPFT